MRDLATRHVRDILDNCLRFREPEQALVVFDSQTNLSRVLTEAYRAALPGTEFIDFDATPPEAILKRFETMKAGDLVILIQSTYFRLNEFRIRIELFKQGLKVIEHMHLVRMDDEAQEKRYVDSLSYDAAYYRGLGPALKKRVEGASRFEVLCDGTKLVYETAMEEAKLNIGDYTGMQNVGGTFPIGEVFTEPKDLARVNGEVKIFAFAGLDHLIQIHQPFTATIKDGILDAPDAPIAFKEILDLIRGQEAVLVREFGLGLNRAFGKDSMVKDITAFERQKGLHFSLGHKHTIYKKPDLSPKETRYHIDIFIDAKEILADGQTIYKDGEFLVT